MKEKHYDHDEDIYYYLRELTHYKAFSSHALVHIRHFIHFLYLSSFTCEGFPLISLRVIPYLFQLANEKLDKAGRPLKLHVTDKFALFFLWGIEEIVFSEYFFALE